MLGLVILVVSTGTSMLASVVVHMLGQLYTKCTTTLCVVPGRINLAKVEQMAYSCSYSSYFILH